MRHRTIVCPLIENKGHYLLCKMAADRGVFPGNGPYPAAARSGERIEEALRREIREELGENSSLPISRHGAFATIPASKPTPTGIRKRSHDLSHLRLRERQSRCDDQRGV